MGEQSPNRQKEPGASGGLTSGTAALATKGLGSIVARSVSRPVWERLQQAPLDGRVLAVFQRACLLLLSGDKVVALVFPEIGDGPLNVVVEKQPSVFEAIEAGTPLRLDEDRLRIGELEAVLDQASVWEPRPDWRRLRRCRAAVFEQLPRLHALALHHAPATSLMTLLPGQTASLPYAAAAQQAAKDLRAGWGGGWDADRWVEAGAERLAGLGGGLTPAGDDFLAGAMLWAWLAHPDPEPFCQVVVKVAAPRTTTLSAAFLRAAAKGECSSAWHDLLTALDGGREYQLAGAVTKVLSYGHTSGTDAVAGFVWMGLASIQAETGSG